MIIRIAGIIFYCCFLLGCASPYERGMNLFIVGDFSKARNEWIKIKDANQRDNLIKKADAAIEIIDQEALGTAALRRGDNAMAVEAYKNAMARNEWSNWESQDVERSLRICENGLTKVYRPVINELRRIRMWKKLKDKVNEFKDALGYLDSEYKNITSEADKWINSVNSLVSKGNRSEVEGDTGKSRNDLSATTLAWQDAINYWQEAISFGPEWKRDLDKKISNIRLKMNKIRNDAFKQNRNTMIDLKKNKEWDDLLKLAKINKEFGAGMHKDIGYEKESIRVSSNAIKVIKAVERDRDKFIKEHGKLLDNKGYFTRESPGFGSGRLSLGKTEWRSGHADAKAWGQWNDIEVSVPIDYYVRIVQGNKSYPSEDRTTIRYPNKNGKALATWRKADTGIIHFVIINNLNTGKYNLKADVYQTIETDY